MTQPADEMPRRKEAFAALVEAQDGEMSVADSRRAVAERFRLTEAEVLAVEREGIQWQWPPLG
jgi:hypothetical protein